jgi:hypothetical protein
MERKSAVFFGLLIGVAVVSMAQGSDSVAPRVLTAQDIDKECTAATSRESSDLKPIGKVGIRADYVIPVYQWGPKLRLTPDVDILGILTRRTDGLDPDAEIPRINVICITNKVQHPNEPGKIEFTTHKGETVSIRFHLDSGLGHTNWNTATVGGQLLANDSIWMTDHPSKPPSAGDWPTCLGGLSGKVVKYDSQLHDISFDMCSNGAGAGGADADYEYALHMQQKDSGTGGASVDVGIDPRIINHPS